MTVAVNGKADVLTFEEAGQLCRAHNELGLTTEQVGAVFFGDRADPELLEQEVRAIMAARPELAEACRRVLFAIGRG